MLFMLHFSEESHKEEVSICFCCGKRHPIIFHGNLPAPPWLSISPSTILSPETPRPNRTQITAATLFRKSHPPFHQVSLTSILVSVKDNQMWAPKKEVDFITDFITEKNNIILKLTPPPPQKKHKKPEKTFI